MAKRLTSSAVNWGYIMETLPPGDTKRLVQLKFTHEKLLREIASKPTELPKIDWASYKTRITAPGMVDAFQKAYEGLKVPYPSDQGLLAENEKNNAELIKYAEDMHQKTLEEIKDLKKKLAEMESMMKLSEMTLEELYLAKPELRIDVDNPKMFPQFLSDPPEAQKADH